MSDPLYDPIIATADRLITKYGRAIVARHVVDGAAPDPTKPWDKPTAGDPIDCPTNGVFTAYDAKSIDGTNIKATDLKLIFTATKLTFDLSSRDVIIDSLYGQIAIIDVTLIQPGSTKVLYTVQTRRG